MKTSHYVIKQSLFVSTPVMDELYINKHLKTETYNYILVCYSPS